jgi:hypothetical protein
MEMSVRHFRSEIGQLARGKAPRAIRYPIALREAAVALGRTRLRQGHSRAAIARELGVSEPTLTGWLRSRVPPIVRPVTVAPERDPERPAPSHLVLTTARGVRVEGLDRRTLLAVLRALA